MARPSNANSQRALLRSLLDICYGVYARDGTATNVCHHVQYCEQSLLQCGWTARLSWWRGVLSCVWGPGVVSDVWGGERGVVGCDVVLSVCLSEMSSTGELREMKTTKFQRVFLLATSFGGFLWN